MKFEALYDPDSKWWYWNADARTWFDCTEDFWRLLRKLNKCTCRRKSV